VLPQFSPAGYSRLLEALQAAGFALRPVEAMSERGAPVAFLRHDVDIHIRGIEELGRREAEAGACATYFVALTQPYNPVYPDNRAVLRTLVGLGHRIGLHYDLSVYPRDPAAARARLLRELARLQTLVGSPVETICMHNPYEGEPDLFAAAPPEGLLNPHSERFAGVRYISDSCRAWRDDALLECLREPQTANLLLNTHPELWLDSPEEGRHAFIEGTLMQAATADAREFLLDVEQPRWRRHPGARTHDERERAARAAGNARGGGW
jgi:hypothetical protein